MSTPTTTNVLGIGLAPLDPDGGATPCGGCGMPVPGDGQHAYTVLAVVRAGGQLEDLAVPATITLAECDACRGIREKAETLVDQFPSLRRLGSRNILRDRVGNALRALDVFHQAGPKEWTADAVLAALTRLENVGAMLAWSARYSPVRQPDAKLDQCASAPYLYNSIELLSEARREVAMFLRDLLPPRPIACPSGACAACGIGAFDGWHVAETWSPIIGGTYGGGHLCPVCRGVANRFPSLGLSVAEAAVLEFIDPDQRLRSRRPYRPTLHGVRMFADTGRRTANSRPWGHMKVNALRQQLESGNW